MNSRFLPTYQALLSGNIDRPVGLWLLHGDEPLLMQWLIDEFRQLFKQFDQPTKHINLTSNKDWYEVLAELDSLSLFGGDNAVLLTGKIAPSADVLNKLGDFTEAVKAGQTTHSLIYELPKQDKKAQTSKLFKLFSTHGSVIDCQLYDEKMRWQVLSLKAQKFGISLDESAWQLLLADTEHNLLAGYQTLWRLSDLYPNTQNISIDALKNALVSDYNYSIFMLCDTLLAGDIHKTLHILHELKRTNTAPSLILWGLTKEIRTLLQLKHKSPQELGIWQSKLSLYHTAQTRLRINDSHLAELYELDTLIKGVKTGNIWQALEMFILKIL